MNTNKTMLEAARQKAMMDAPLRKALEEWLINEESFNLKWGFPGPGITDFGEWVENRADILAGEILDVKQVTVDNLVTALRVHAIGDGTAIRLARGAEEDGWDADTNCYVEEGVVYATVWLGGKDDAKATEKKADEIGAEFRKIGYAVDVFVDEEDDKEVTVHASIAFPLFVEMQKKGGR